MTTQAATCETCGRSVDAGAKFCAFCGSNVSAAQGQLATRHISAGQTAHLQDELLHRLRDATLGDYEVLTELGRGGMATVYLGHDLQLDRKVAIKVMLPALLEGEGMIERFKLEARTAAQLSHPHIIPIYAVRDQDDLLFFVMKFVEGRPLDSISKQLGKVPVRMVQSILARVGEALGYAHRKGVVHRDIKPANLMIDVEGLPVVTDFGIAKVSEARGLTMTGATIGTPHYMSPEQCAAGKITGSSDQYSLGVVAYEMLSGNLPFQGDSIVSLLYKHCHEPPPPFNEAVPECPPALHDAVMKMLAKDPAERFPTLEAAVDAVGNISLAFDDPMRSQLITLAKQGIALAALKRISTPRSPTPIRSRTMKRTAAKTQQPAITSVPASAGVPTLIAAPARSSRGLVWGVGATIVVAGAAVGVWRPWERGTPVVPATATIARLTVEPATGVLDVGDSLQLAASPRDSSNQPVSAPVRWTSADTAIASVTATGQVHGLAPGVARILATAGGAQSIAQFTVAVALPPPTSGTAGPVARILVQGAPPTLAVGSAAQLRATPVDSRGSAAADGTVSWSSSAPSVASVSRGGLVTAVSPGSATVTARSGVVRQSVELQIVRPTVTPPVASGRPASVSVTGAGPLAVGATIRLTATVVGDDGRALGVPVSWRSGSPAVATVSDGVVTAVAAGTSVITATADGREGATTVTVTAPEIARPTPPPPAVDVNPRDAIAAVVQDYAQALESRQISELRRVYPGMSADQENQTSQSLRSMDSLRVRLRIGNLDIQGDVANASVSGEYEFYSRENRRTERLPVRFQASLERGPSGWRIRSIR